ncbi:MAG TPA: branched-chain amino acid ABC transporter substrate-binding protein [Nitrospiria bacterium]|nr:branched-chain amino acid ABC transporter substrate-binding protein [Nitrospiria bacterium]
MNLSGKKAGVFIFFGLMLIFFWMLQACQQKETTIKIGVAGPMTGDQSKMGIDEKNGADLAVSEWNERGGVLGRKIELIVADDQHDPKQAVAVANRLVNSGVAGVIGHWNSGSSIPASDVYHQAGIPMITPASTNPDLTERKYENVFRICGRDDQQGKIAADFALSRKSFRKVAILHDKTAYGQGLAQEFQKNLVNKIEIAAYEGITQGEKDFRGILTTIKGKEPDLIFFGGIYPEAAQLVRQARELGLKAPMLSGDGTFDQTFIKIAGEAAEGTFLTFSSDPSRKPEVKGVLDRYHGKYGEHGPYSLYAYDAANVLLEAMAEAKTTEPASLNKSLHQISLQGTTGQIQFDRKGDLLVSPYVVWVVKGGKFEEVWKP